MGFDTHAIASDKRRRKRRVKPGDTRALQRLLWQAMLQVEVILEEEEPPDTRLRAASALGTLGGVYLRAIEQAELTVRLEAVEKQLASVEGPSGGLRVG